ncbi:Gfo/Idh/MocA family oxidoreductase [Microbacterium sp.]|uniref:Gfo/Idh/MocA family protein n=1 Tax=Microbacterium sp. TaxID=51671 RepID=UPI00333FC791
MIRVAVISFAHVHAEGYLRALARRADVELLSCDPDGGSDPDRGAALAARVGVAFVQSLREVSAWAPDAVVVASENADHRRYVEWAAGQGFHVLCEKPIATTVEDGRAMVAACAQAGVQLMIAYPVRFSPMFQELKRLVDAGGLGRILHVYGTNNGKIPVGERAWFGEKERSGGGSLIDHTVHIADLLDVLLDGRAAADVHAAVNNVLYPELVDVETAGVVTVRYEGGPIASIECGWSHPRSHPTWGGLALTVVGEKGIVELDAFPRLAEGLAAGSGVGRWYGGGPDLDALMLDEFLSAIATGRAPASDGASAIRSLSIVESAYRALSLQSAETASSPE